MRFSVFFCSLLLWASPVGAAMLGIPAPNAIHSGIGVISGWKCEASGPLTIRFNGGRAVPLVYGTERPDVRRNGQCLAGGHDNVGFVAIWNWGELGSGQHQAVVYDNGVAFARRVFHVAAFAEPFVRGAQGGVWVQDFPFKGDESYFQWNQATQHLELFEFYPGNEPEPEPERQPEVDPQAVRDLAFLLDRDRWVIAVPDIPQWVNVSSQRRTDGQPGNQLLPAPADIEFFPYERGVTPWREYPATPYSGVELVGRLQGTYYNAAQEALREGLPHLVELGGLLDVLPVQTALDLGVELDRYALVVTSRIGPGGNSEDYCYILTFNHITRTAGGGMRTRAFFAITERTLRSPHYASECTPTILTKGQSTALTITLP